MPTHRQGTTKTVPEPQPPTSGPPGSNQLLLARIFKDAPQFSEGYAPDSVRELGLVFLTEDDVNDGGHTFFTFNRDYKGAPNVPDQKADNAGDDVVSPHAPPPASPGAGSFNPKDQNKDVKPKKGGGGAFVGDGLSSPHLTSAEVSKQKFLNLPPFGKSTKPSGP